MINFQVYKNGISIDCDYDYEALKIFDFKTLFNLKTNALSIDLGAEVSGSITRIS